MYSYEDRKKIVGQRIEKERKRLGISQKDLLTRIFKSEKSHKTLASWEKGERLPDLDSLVLMADLFHCDVGYLLGDYNEHTRTSADVVKETGLSEAAVDLILKIAAVNQNLSKALSCFITSAGFVNFLVLFLQYRNRVQFIREYQKQIDRISCQIDDDTNTLSISELVALSEEKEKKQRDCQEHCDAKEVLEYKVQKIIFSILNKLEESDNG